MTGELGASLLPPSSFSRVQNGSGLTVKGRADGAKDATVSVEQPAYHVASQREATGNARSAPTLTLTMLKVHRPHAQHNGRSTEQA